MMKNLALELVVVLALVSLMTCRMQPFEKIEVPRIEPSESSITIEVNSDKKIECSANYPVIWISEILQFRDNHSFLNTFVDTSGDENVTYRSNLKFESITSDYVGKYYCVLNSTVKDYKEASLEKDVVQGEASSIYIFVEDPDNLIVKNVGFDIIEGLQFEPFVIPCKPTSPRVRVELLREDGRVNIQGRYDPQTGFTVSFNHVAEDSGVYYCRVQDNKDIDVKFHVILHENKAPFGEKSFLVADRRSGTHELSERISIGIACLTLLILSFTIFSCARFRQKRAFKRKMEAAFANFEEGNIERFNSGRNLDDQADLLPYDKNVEFPRDRLKLGKQLGAGAFGVVFQATAQGILSFEEKSTVAVKMVKKHNDIEVTKALVSELKILIHLGQHLNVVNLLGAVTKKIVQRELMVIVEFCQFGNLQRFLVNHRSSFVNQIRDGEIDPMIMINDVRFSQNDVPTSSRMCSTCHTKSSQDSSRNSDQPVWTSSFLTDFKGPTSNVCTSDLLCWSFQVARGMGYLSAQKVLHGDLAARNILLCKDNIVKICDFGLSRSLYKNDNYKKKGEEPLPVKWLALECISDHLFSTFSDVWAFGVVLWELFSLGKVPYTGMEANQNLYHKLRDGYRMEKPEFANDDLYEIMRNCWKFKPDSRPLFDELENTLGRFLHQSVKDHYIDLNKTYLVANENRYRAGRPDYISWLTCPRSEAPKPPVIYTARRNSVP